MITFGALYFLVPRLWGARRLYSLSLVSWHSGWPPSASSSTRPRSHALESLADHAAPRQGGRPAPPRARWRPWGGTGMTAGQIRRGSLAAWLAGGVVDAPCHGFCHRLAREGGAAVAGHGARPRTVRAQIGDGAIGRQRPAGGLAGALRHVGTSSRRARKAGTRAGRRAPGSGHWRACAPGGLRGQSARERSRPLARASGEDVAPMVPAATRLYPHRCLDRRDCNTDADLFGDAQCPAAR
jgi:hypothetical protein